MQVNADLTKSILLQIISEQESNDQQSLLTNTVLKQLIRYYDTEMQLFMRQYLEQSIAVFLQRQDALQGMMKDLVDASPFGLFNQMLEQNMKVWSDLGEWRNFPGPVPKPKGGEKPE